MVNNYERNYVELVKLILAEGSERSSRAGDTYSLFDKSLSFDLSAGFFPLLEGRKLYYKGVFGELAAMLRGDITHVDNFIRFGCNYWEPWADADGQLRLDYGNSWRDFNGADQLANVVASLRSDPYGRRHIITGWRPDRLDELSLPCCHMLYQWYVRDGYLDMMWYQRSTDVMIGLPSDAILAAVWTILLAKETGLMPGQINMHLGDTHIYKTHFVATHVYLDAVERNSVLLGDGRAKYKLLPDAKLFSFHPDSIQILDYYPEEHISFSISV